MDAFHRSINSQFKPVSEEEAAALLEFYGRIKHNIDPWHKAKNVRKNVGRIVRV